MCVTRKLKGISFALAIGLIAFSCKTGKDKTSSKSSGSTSKVEEGHVKAKLDCQGESSMEQLFINGTQPKVSGLSCNITRFGSGDNSGLIILYKARNGADTVQVQFHLHGVEESKIKPAKYEISDNHSKKFGKLFIESGNPKVIQEIDTYKGVIEIVDYGYSSNTICGMIDLRDSRGNKIIGRFYEMISAF